MAYNEFSYPFEYLCPLKLLGLDRVTLGQYDLNNSIQSHKSERGRVWFELRRTGVM